MSKIPLNNDEKEIFNLIKEYNKRKSVVKIVNLVNYINNRLKYNSNFNRNKIERIVKVLIKKKIILIGTKLTKEDILKTQIRKDIYDNIKKSPGININELKNRFRLGSNQILWHLEMLKNFEFIRMVEIQNQKAIFDFNFDKNKENLIFYLRNEKIQQIITLLKRDKEPLRLTKISDLLKIHFNTTKKYLKILLKFSIIIMVNGNKKKRYQLNQNMPLNLEELL